VNNYYNFRNIQGRDSNAGLYLKIIQERLDSLGQRGIPLVVSDARNYNKLSKILGQIKPDTLVHLAAVSHAGKSNKDPYSTFDHSLRTLENALDNTRSPALPIRHFVYFSSSMIYGNFTSESVTEESVCEPLGIYGALKFAGEKMVIAYNQVFGLPYTIVRPSALYGPRCVSRRVGQIFIENVMSGREVCVHGDGDDKLDFTYIDDLTIGIVNVLENESSKNQIFNLTYGRSRSINDMVEIMTGHFPGIEVKYLPKDKLMPKRGTLSINKARKMIGYDPKYPLEAGFVRYIHWYRRYSDFIRGTCEAELASSGV
jgi:nucleoside-diphosphate-sugar epimerase